MKVVKSINLDEKYWKILKEIAKEDCRSVSGMIEFLIKKYIEKEEK